MRLLKVETTISDPGSFIAAISDVVDEAGATVQAFGVRYVADREHLERAVEFADGTIARGNEIARDHVAEILLYANDRRQINRAFETGVSEEALPVVAPIDGGDETAAEAALLDRLDFEPTETLGDYGESLVRDVFDVSETELHVVDGDLPALVRKRVAPLAVDRQAVFTARAGRIR